MTPITDGKPVIIPLKCCTPSRHLTREKANMLTLIKNADIYAPESIGVGYLLLGGGKILRVGRGDAGIDDSWLDDTLDMDGAAGHPRPD